MPNPEDDIENIRKNIEKTIDRVFTHENDVLKTFPIPVGTKLRTSPLDGGGYFTMVTDREKREFLIMMELRSCYGQTRETQCLFLNPNKPPYILSHIGSANFNEHSLSELASKLFNPEGPGIPAELTHLLEFRRILDLITS